jgi:Na+/melibiose symporter-like transporter
VKLSCHRAYPLFYSCLVGQCLWPLHIPPVCLNPNPLSHQCKQKRKDPYTYFVTIVAPLFWFTSIELGGFSFSPPLISAAIAISGATQAVWLLVFFPPLQRRIGTGGVLRICAVLFVLSYLTMPVCNTLLRHGQNVAFWILGSIALLIGSASSMSFSKFSTMSCQIDEAEAQSIG